MEILNNKSKKKQGVEKPEIEHYEYVSWSDAPEDIQKMIYSGYCTPEETARAVHPQNGKDYLLSIRAKYIADNIRLNRVFIHLSRYYGDKWSLEKFYNTNAYGIFRMALSKENNYKCKDITCGCIYDNNANGLVFSSPFGILSTYSKTLDYFSNFANLAIGNFQQEVPPHIRFNAMRIACRIMLRTESDDFIVDPRGIIPKKIMDSLNQMSKLNKVFLAGHELCHFILGHIKEQGKTEIGFLKPHFKDDTDYKKINGYRIEQNQEFEADLSALNFFELPDDAYSHYYNAALNWFAILSIYEGVEDSITPPMGVQTHPGAIARYSKILNEARRPIDFDEKLYSETLPQLISVWRERMIEDVSVNYELYEQYGSVYLDAPNTEWRGRELIDRVDY